MTMFTTPRILAIAALLIASSSGAQGSSKPKTLQTRVWVNNLTRVYHCPGSLYYGTTRSGEYMEEAQARGMGYRAMLRRGCANAASSGRAPLPDSAPATKKMVWVNTESGVYHCPNSADWGNTTRGRYLLEADAATAGHKPSTGKKCTGR